ncbi:MAG: hypothetical protein ACYDEB_13830 [Dehalococcoidia bacterium]
MRRHLLLVAAVPTSALIAFAIVVTTNAFQPHATGVNGKPIELTPGPPAFPNATAVEALTNYEARTVRDLVSADSTVAAVTGGQALNISSIGVWTEGPNRIGAVAEVHLDRPKDVDTTWTVLDQSPQAQMDSRFAAQGYVTAPPRQLRVLGLTDFLVFIDLRSHRIVSVSPLRASGANKPAATTTP